MPGKISLSFGNYDNHLSVDEAVQFFLGCSDVFVEMGLPGFRRMIDLVEVVRVYPNTGGMSHLEREIVVDVVVSSSGEKVHDSFTVRLKYETSILTLVKAGVIRITRTLAESLLGRKE